MGKQNITHRNEGLIRRLGKLYSGFFPGVERRAIAVVFLFLALWTLLAQIIFLFLPDQNVGAFDAVQSYLSYVWRNSLFLFLILICLFVLRLARQSSGQSLFGYMRAHGAHLKKSAGNTGIRLVLGIATFFVFSAAYTGIKTRISTIMPFYADEVFADMDRWLFLGNDPWTYFAFLYEYPAAIIAIDFFYDTWAAILVCTWIACFIIARKRPDAYRYNIAILLTWFIGGNVAALLLSSAGPCYYEFVTGDPNIYGDQMSALAAIQDGQLRSTIYQGILWDQYASNIYGFGGISAMPSMHCATSFLLVWAFGHYHRYLKYFLVFFCVLICLSSFILAWHYAVDAVLAFGIAALCWYLSGVIIKSSSNTELVKAELA